MTLISCEISLITNWSVYFLITDSAGVRTFATSDTKLY